MKKRWAWRFKAMVLAAGLVWWIGGVAGADDEAVFEAAKKYTVKVRTQVSLPFAEDRKGASTGAGFVVDAKKGWIMTNAHVASRSPAAVSAAFRGGEYFPVRKVYVDPFVDLAILEIPDSARWDTRAEAALDCSSVPGVGHPVGAFGHPWQIHFTGTRGIVSGKTAKFKGMIEMVQTDAPIDPGNSGGPLISLKSGKVVGINTAKKPDSQGTNFAVPMPHACRVLDLHRAGLDPSPPDLPVSFLRDSEESRNLVVAKAHEKDPGRGLRENDTILGISGEEVEFGNRGQMLQALRGRGDTIRLRVRRGKEEMDVPVGLKPAERITERRGIFLDGALFALTPADGGADILRDLHRLMIHHVEVGSEAQAEHMERWDFLVSVDGIGVNALDEAYERLKEAQAAGRKAVLKILHVEFVFGDIFSYTEARLPVEDLRWIGPDR